MNTPAVAASRMQSMAHDRLLPLILRLALPSVIGVTVSAAYQLLNAYFVGWLGTAALAAMALSYPFAMCITAIGQIFGAGAASLIARSLGRADDHSANDYASHALWSAMVIAGIAAIAGWLLAPIFLAWLGAGPSTMPLAVAYLHWLLLGYVAVVFNMVCGFIVRADGNTVLSMTTQVSSFAMNAALDPVMIFWLGLGIAGAGIATFLAQLCGLTLYWRHFAGRHGAIVLSWPSVGRCWCRLASVARIGIPPALNTLLAVAAMSMLNGFAARYGEASVAAIGLASRLAMLAVLPLYGLCSGAQSVVGFNVGADNWTRVAQAVRTMVAIALTFAGVYAGWVVWQARTIIGWFAHDSATIEIGGRAILLFHCALPVLGVHQVCLLFMQTKGDAISATLVSVLRHGVFLMPLMVLLQHAYGQGGLLFSVAAADMAAGLIAIVILYSEMRQIDKASRLSQVNGMGR
ncbi:MATE family efflux transporter [Paraburkholderia mimosarum]|uniref:MATE family efflux transporter n=1 Tax=Paraburkholderia mimosarum TaxID=312026 RepID=UPI0003FB9AD5|nr:MATE family efflux transporter [Paraburkholderia mimosarum]